MDCNATHHASSPEELLGALVRLQLAYMPKVFEQFGPWMLVTGIAIALVSLVDDLLKHISSAVASLWHDLRTVCAELWKHCTRHDLWLLAGLFALWRVLAVFR